MAITLILEALKKRSTILQKRNAFIYVLRIVIENMKKIHLNDSARTCLLFYYDFKKGILKADASNDEIKKFNKKELYRAYWKKCVEDFGVEIRVEVSYNRKTAVSEAINIPGCWPPRAAPAERQNAPIFRQRAYSAGSIGLAGRQAE